MTNPTKQQGIDIGEYSLRPIIVRAGDKPPYYDENHIWIEHKSGEGMSIKTEILGAAIHKFYEEHF